MPMHLSTVITIARLRVLVSRQSTRGQTERPGAMPAQPRPVTSHFREPAKWG